MTYNASWYRVIATDPRPIALGGATLAVVPANKQHGSRVEDMTNQRLANA